MDLQMMVSLQPLHHPLFLFLFPSHFPHLPLTSFSSPSLPHPFSFLYIRCCVTLKSEPKLSFTTSSKKQGSKLTDLSLYLLLISMPLKVKSCWSNYFYFKHSLHSLQLVVIRVETSAGFAFFVHLNSFLLLISIKLQTWIPVPLFLNLFAPGESLEFLVCSKFYFS
jgi:hypothetical protein